MAIENLQDRIGTLDLEKGEDGKDHLGKRNMPAVDVNGHVYQYPGAGWWHLDRTRFVVVPINFKDTALIDAIKAELGDSAKPRSKAKNGE